MELKLISLFSFPGNRHSRARRISESAFGIIAKMWGILQKPICMKPEKVDSLILAICSLHNMLRSRNALQIHSSSGANTDNGNESQNSMNLLNGVPAIHGHRFTHNSVQIRENFTEFFNNEGAVSWQNKVLAI
jgi:DDE superfamily endonuclease